MKPKSLNNSTFFGTYLFKQAISKDHPFRFLLETINWNEIKTELRKDNAGMKIKYSHTGTPAIDPIIIFKLMILQRWHPASDRKVVDRAITDISYRYFLNIPIPMKIPDYSNLSRYRKLWGPEKLKKVFTIFFEQIQKMGFADVSKGVVGDITHANIRIQSLTARNLLLDCFRKYLIALNKFTNSSFNQNCILDDMDIITSFDDWLVVHKAKIKANELTREERFSEAVLMIIDIRKKVESYLKERNKGIDVGSKEYLEFQAISDLLDQIILENTSFSGDEDAPDVENDENDNSGDNNNPSKEHAKRQSTIRQKKGKRKIVSTVDPEVRIGCKHNTKYFIGPKISTIMTTDGFIANIDAIQGNIADKTQGIIMLDSVISSTDQIPNFAGFDRGFNTLEMRKYCHDRNIKPGIEFENPVNKRNKGLYTAEAFIFDPENLSVLCPNQNTTFKFSKAGLNNNLVFRFDKENCQVCPSLQNCTTSKTGRTITISRSKSMLDADKEFLKTDEYETIRCLRWQQEGWYGWAKKEHSLGDIPYYGLKMSKLHVLLTGITVNLKKLYRYLTNKIKTSNKIIPIRDNSVSC